MQIIYCTNYTATCLPSQKLCKLDEPDTQDTAGEARTNASVMYSYGPTNMAKQKQDDQLEHTYSSYVRIRDVALKTCLKRWLIGRSGERGSGISVLAARRHDDYYQLLMIFKHHHHHHHVVPLTRISLTLTRHFSLSFVASDRSSGLHPVSLHSCWMYIRAGCPAFARTFVGVHF